MIRFNVSDSQKFATARKYRKNGFLYLPDCAVARSGILQYSDVQAENGETVADGQLINVYRPPEALKACLKEFSNLPLALTHPQGQAITPENAKGHTVGALGNNPHWKPDPENGKDIIVYCDIVVYDETAQKAVEDGTYEQLSAGYETAFRKQRGVAPDGQSYEAVQYLLQPNHVALVQQGRCGEGCKVCDQIDIEDPNKEKKRMKITKRDQKASRADAGDKKAAKYRFFLQKNDEDKNVEEISPEVAEMLSEDNPDTPVEELNEEDVKIKPDGDDDSKLEGTDKDKDIQDDNDTNVPGIKPEEKNKEPKEDDNETEGEEGKEDEPKTDDGELIEVKFEDGEVGKMDQVAYEHVQRLMEVTKRGDSAEKSVAELAVLTADAKEILGSEFDIKNFVVDGKIMTSAIKRKVIAKVNPDIVCKTLRGDALDSVFQMSVKTAAKRKGDWKADFQKLADAAEHKPVADAAQGGLIAKARKAYEDKKQNVGKKKE